MPYLWPTAAGAGARMNNLFAQADRRACRHLELRKRCEPEKMRVGIFVDFDAGGTMARPSPFGGGRPRGK